MYISSIHNTSCTYIGLKWISMSSVSRSIHIRIINPKYQPFPIFRWRLMHNNVYALLTSMMKILSDPIINQAIGSPVNKLVLAKPCNSASGLLVFYQFATNSIQNNQNLNFSAGTLPTKSGNSTLSTSFMMETQMHSAGPICVSRFIANKVEPPFTICTLPYSLLM